MRLGTRRWRKGDAAIRRCPTATLLDLHPELHLRRRINTAHQIDFPGRSRPFAATKRTSITIIHSILGNFWAVTYPHSHHKISGPKSWDVIPCKLSTFELTQVSHFELPPTGHGSGLAARRKRGMMGLMLTGSPKIKPRRGRQPAGRSLPVARQLKQPLKPRIRCAVTLSMVPESKGGPFVFSGDLNRGCARAAALGFDAVELFLPSAEAVTPSDLRSVLKKHGLALAALGSGAGWIKHRLTLTSPDPSVRVRACEFIGSLIDLGAALDAPVIIGSMQGRVEPESGRKQAEKWLAEGLKSLGRRAGRHGIPLLYEPLNRYETNLFNRAEDAAAFLSSRKISHVKLLCDLFHMNLEEASIPAALRAVAGYLGHVHFADSNRQAIGFGHLETAPIIEALLGVGYKGYLSAEVLPLPTPEAAARQTRNAFCQLLKTDQPRHA